MHKELVILIDALEEATIRHLQDSSLLHFGYIAALHAQQSAGNFRLGLCAVHRQANGQDVQLKVLQRPGPFSLREFSLAVQKLHASATSGTSDPAKTGLALRSLLTHLAGRSGLPSPLQTTVCLLGHVFSYQAFRRAIADSGRAGIRLQFVALVPSVDAGGPCMSDADRSTFLMDLVDATNATASFVPNDPESLQQLALQWVRDFVLPPARAVVVKLPTSQLHCTLLSQVLPLTAKLAHGQLCACHKAPLAGVEPDTIAAGMCSVGGALLPQHAVVPDPHIVELGHSTRLAFAPGAQLPSLRVELPISRRDDGAGSQDAAESSVRANAVTLRCVRQLKDGELSEGLMWGQPHLLAARSDGLEDFDACEANEQAMAALCQVLRDSGSALLLAAGTDLDGADRTPATAGAASSSAAAGPFTCYYAARPAADCAALLVRRTASAEELLPVVAALPPPCQPSQEAVVAAQTQLSQLPACGTGGLYSPLDHSSGACGLLRSLLQGSLPAQPRPPMPVMTQPLAAQQQPAAAAEGALQREHGHAAVPEPHRHASGGAAAGDGHHRAAAQLGGRLQRLRLPDYAGGSGAGAGAAAAAAPGSRRIGVGGEPSAADAARSSGRQPLRACQPARISTHSDGARRQEAGALGAPDTEDDWPDSRPQKGDGVTRFDVAVPQPVGRGGSRKGRQRSSGGSACGGLQLKRLRKAK